MIHNLHIQNYKNLKNLNISHLKRVNLIIGKNNTGKSNLLEAIAIYTSQGDLDTIMQILKEREEFGEQGSSNHYNNVEKNIQAFASLFTGRKASFDEEDAIHIQSGTTGIIRMKFIQSISPIRSETKIKTIENIIISFFKIGIEVKVHEHSYIIALDNNSIFAADYALTQNKINNIQFVNTRNIRQQSNSLLWDSIVFSDKEEYVLKAIQIIEKECEAITFIQDTYSSTRKAIAKLKGLNQKIPLNSMGDGINRILNIILCMVNAENGYLLIDELENGLHYSVQEKLWRVIFDLAMQLNIQVFVTTHSRDCLESFANVLHSSENCNYGTVIRLDNLNGEIIATIFDENEVKIATERNIEIR